MKLIFATRLEYSYIPEPFLMIYHYVKNINNKQKQNATMFFQHANMNTVLGPTCLQMKSLFQSNDEKVGKQKRKKKQKESHVDLFRPLP